MLNKMPTDIDRVASLWHACFTALCTNNKTVPLLSGCALQAQVYLWLLKMMRLCGHTRSFQCDSRGAKAAMATSPEFLKKKKRTFACFSQPTSLIAEEEEEENLYMLQPAYKSATMCHLVAMTVRGLQITASRCTITALMVHQQSLSQKTS